MGSGGRERGRVVNRVVMSGIVSSWWKPCWAASGCVAGWRRGFGLSRAESDGSMSSNATWGIQVSFQLTQVWLMFPHLGSQRWSLFFITFCSCSHSHHLSGSEGNVFWLTLLVIYEWRHLRISPFLLLCVVCKPQVSGSRKPWFNAFPRWLEHILGRCQFSSVSSVNARGK